jgi:hypothetical protein
MSRVGNPANPYAAEVGVAPGNDVALETIATFTNSSGQGKTGQLKICKIAGAGVEVGTPFNFMVSEGSGTKAKYTIEAGPSPGGYCELSGTYPVGSEVKVMETVPKGIFASIQVQPPANGGAQTVNSVQVTIAEGVTEVNFTDSTTPPVGKATLTPTKFTFPKQKIDTNSKPKAFVLTNTGSVTMTISSIVIGGANPGDFFISSTTCGSTLPGSASCTINVILSLTMTGTRTAQLIVTDNASNSPQVSNLTGTGV